MLPASSVRVEAELDRLPSATGTQLGMNPATHEVFQTAQKEADRLKDEYVSTEHLMLALVQVRSEARDILSIVRGEIRRGSRRPQRRSRRPARHRSEPEEKYQALQRYGRDLVQLARQGKLDPVIGRDEEIRRTMQVLARRTKNNPVLIGEPGVGKTAIVEGLAIRIVNGGRSRRAQEQRLVAHSTWAPSSPAPNTAANLKTASKPSSRK